MPRLRNKNFNSVDICRLMKNQLYKKKIKDKNIFKFYINFSILPGSSRGFKEKECSTYCRTLYTPKNIT